MSIGAHHDAITGTSKPHVHVDENIKFSNAIESIDFVSEQTLTSFHNFSDKNRANKGNKIPKNLAQLSIYNPSLYPRSDTVRFNVDVGFSETVKYKGYFNGQPVKTYTQSTFTISGLQVIKEPSQGVIIFDV